MLLGTEELLVLSLPLPGGGKAEHELTPAEREVALAVLDGASNREIARRRGRSVRTVTTQIETIYRKLGVSCRAELARRLTR